MDGKTGLPIRNQLGTNVAGCLPPGKLGKAQVRELLERQRYRCALTGRELTPGEATIDHVVPMSKGGSDCASNAQIIIAEVNRAKGQMSNVDFVKLCVDVANHAQAVGVGSS
jgi:5-methylcytosine-specific restriction endonuclease McrA